MSPFARSEVLFLSGAIAGGSCAHVVAEALRGAWLSAVVFALLGLAGCAIFVREIER